MMRKAQVQDLDVIMAIMKTTIQFMQNYGNTQWDENYPQQSDILQDILHEAMYVSERNGQLAGFICINHAEPTEYQSLPWAQPGIAVVVHRMAVADAFRKQGVASELMAYADELARTQNNYLKTDTYSLNKYAQALFERCGYRQVGTMKFRGKPLDFYCYEKILAN